MAFLLVWENVFRKIILKLRFWVLPYSNPGETGADEKMSSEIACSHYVETTVRGPQALWSAPFLCIHL